MSSGQQALLFVVQTVLQLSMSVMILRFMLQLAKADFYNPISQAIVKISSPLLTPMRRIIPSYKNWDFASLLLAMLLYLLMWMATVYIIIGQFVNPLSLLGGSLAGVLYSISKIYFYAIILSAISSWIPPLHGHPITALVWQLVEPVLAPFRKLLPNMGGLDISPIFAILALQVLQILLRPYVPL